MSTDKEQAGNQEILSISIENRVFDPPEQLSKTAHITSMEQYQQMWEESRDDPDGFWGKQARELLDWDKQWDKVFEWEDQEDIIFSWFKGGKLNVSVNCLDRQLKTRGDKPALVWEGDEPGVDTTLTYRELYDEVNKFASVLKKKGIKKGDCVCIYMPMILELPIAMLACTRIGAIHSIVFGGFSSDSLRDRILDSQAKMLITSDGGKRGGRDVPLKANADAALEGADGVESMIVVRHTHGDVPMIEGRDLWWHEQMQADDVQGYCEPEPMDAEDPLFILYTSGSTGKPKGVLHTTAGYLLYVTSSFKYIFNMDEKDVFWCTADIGWVTGHSYIVYGPLCNGATSVMFEGVPTYPDPGRFWAVVDKYKVNQFYTAPTAIRAIAKEGDEWPAKYDLSSLKLLGTVGEPINPEAWIWYYKTIGKERCPIVDTYWQTETGGFIVTPLPGAMPLKPGSACKPFFGVFPKIVREDGSECKVNEGGYLIIERPWPGIMRTVYQAHERFKETYWARFPGNYTTGDGARKDEDGYYWIMGRLDDVINVSGHRMGSAEVESALVSHRLVAEAAVVGMPHDIKGQGIYAFVTLNAGIKTTEDLKNELIKHVRTEIGPIASPDKIQFTDGLPKTRSGKIMRRILKRIASGEVSELGDTTTLADPGVVKELVAGRQ